MTRFLCRICILLFFMLLPAGQCLAFYDPEPNAEPQKGEWGYRLRNIPLVWSPTKSITGFDPIDTTPFRKAKISVRPFTDARKDKAEIGRNTERKEPRLVTTKEDVPAWLTKQFIQTLAEFNVNSAAADSGVIMETSVLKLYVTETSTYKADIAVNIILKTKDNKLLWEGMIFGAARNFGASYKEENYYEVISNAVLDLVYNFLKSEPIKQVLK